MEEDAALPIWIKFNLHPIRNGGGGTFPHFNQFVYYTFILFQMEMEEEEAPLPIVIAFKLEFYINSIRHGGGASPLQSLIKN